MIDYLNRKKPLTCTICGLKVKDFYRIIANKKDFNICNGCFKRLYESMGKFVTPKSPTSILKNNNIIKEDEF